MAKRYGKWNKGKMGKMMGTRKVCWAKERKASFKRGNKGAMKRWDKLKEDRR